MIGGGAPNDAGDAIVSGLGDGVIVGCGGGGGAGGAGADELGGGLLLLGGDASEGHGCVWLLLVVVGWFVRQLVLLYDRCEFVDRRKLVDKG